MRGARVATWALIVGAFAFVLVPTVVGAAHAPAAQAIPSVHVTVMDQGNGCGYEHGPNSENGNDGNHDDNNGVGNDDDGDHDCTEQDTD